MDNMMASALLVNLHTDKVGRGTPAFISRL
jgi:hypothetical protein